MSRFSKISFALSFALIAAYAGSAAAQQQVTYMPDNYYGPGTPAQPFAQPAAPAAPSYNAYNQPAAQASQPYRSSKPYNWNNYNWSGTYVGVTIGAGQGNTRRDFSDFGTTTGTFSANGVIGGGTIGHNWQAANNFVFGLEGDFSGSGADGTANQPNRNFTYDTSSQWLATLRPRIGYAIGPVLPYVTGGLAVGDLRTKTTLIQTGQTGSSFSGVEPGWTIGAGAEVSLIQNLSLKAEYLYVNLSDLDGPSSTGTPSTVKFDENIERVGLNYNFN